MSASAASAVLRLESLMASGGFSAEPAKLAEYAVDGITPAAVARPTSAEEVVEIVKFAAAEGLALIPCGAHTKIGIGMPPTRYDVAVDLTRMDKIAAYDPEDLTLSVEPGVLLRNLQRELGQKGQMLPLGAPFMTRATVGGTVASGVDGPLRLFYGTAREFNLGIEFVTGDGVAGKSGGRVVKNVSGYDLHKLMIGSLGTLGILTKVNFRTFPAPENVRAFIAHFPAVEDTAAFRDKMATSLLRPLTFEILSPQIAALFESAAAGKIEANPLPAGLLSRTSWMVATGFSGNSAVLDRCEREVRSMAEGAGATHLAKRGTDDRPADLAAAFGRKREFIPIALESSPACTIMKVSVVPEHLEHALAAMKHAAEDHSLPWGALARGVGVIYLALLPAERDQKSLNCVLATTNRIQEDCAQLAGHSTIPWCPSEWKSALRLWGPERADLALMRKVKNVFDPRGTLAPGRFMGGI
jgi:glycolate oxidase FAD binding subunit